MIYKNIKTAKFLNRPNRFIAHIEIDGREEICHVKNTGRCKELLTENATVFVQEADNPSRKTRYDLIGVVKGERMINMDSQIPNKVFREWAENSGYFGDITLLKGEKTFENSRFDFYIETEKDKIFVEVKGVSLEEDGVVLFPDAPTERGVKHINELMSAVADGYEGYILFVIQMKEISCMMPNDITHKAFGDALRSAEKCGIKILAVDCIVTPDSIICDKNIKVKL